MDRYKIVKKGLFESISKFQERVNSLSLEGWKAISMAADQSTFAVLMERER